MKGGFNKMFRNFAAMKGGSPLDKVRFSNNEWIIKASYGHDNKEPKEKHVRCKFILV